VKGKKPEQSEELLDLTGKLRRLSKFPSAHGGYADIWLCTYSFNLNQDQVRVMVISTVQLCSHLAGAQVAVKVMRGHLEDGSHTSNMPLASELTFHFTWYGCSHGAQCIERELNVRKKLHHPNILPLLGVCHDFSPFPSLVSPWMIHGHVNKYLSRAQPPATIDYRLEIVSFVRSVCEWSNVLLDSLVKFLAACTTVRAWCIMFRVDLTNVSP
jgi:serine/threonine protein kinase